MIQMGQRVGRLSFERSMSMPCACPWAWGAGLSIVGRDPPSSLAREGAAPLLHPTHTALVTIPFNPCLFTEGASHIFSRPVSGQPLGLSWQPRDCWSASSSCPWLLSVQLRPSETASAWSRTPPRPPLPSGQGLSSDMALPQHSTRGTLTGGGPSFPRAGARETAEPWAPLLLLSSFAVILSLPF